MSDEALLAEAARWLERTADNNPAAQDGFAAWLARSPRHEQAFARVSRTADAIGDLADAPALLDLRRQTLTRASAARRGRGWRPRLKHAVPAAALVAMAPLAAIGMRWWPTHRSAPMQTESFHTAIGQQAEVTLTDGTGVILDTNSGLLVRVQGSERCVRLVGQAWFRIAPGAAPLLIDAGDHHLLARAGSFDVRVEPGLVRAYAVEAGLALADSAVTYDVPAGHLLVARDGAVLSSPLAQADRYTGWQTGLIQFADAPVSEVAAELNRYRRHPIRIADAQAAGLRVSGAFHTAEGPAFPAALAAGFPVRIAGAVDGGVVIASR